MRDEYERAALELKSALQTIGDAEYARVADARTENENCRLNRTIVSQVVRAGYGYANYVREQFAMAVKSGENKQISRGEIGGEIDKMLVYTIETLDGRWEMTEEEIMNAVIKAHWVVTYDIEHLLEYARFTFFATVVKLKNFQFKTRGIRRFNVLHSKRRRLVFKTCSKPKI